MAHDEEKADEHFNMVKGISHVPDVSVKEAFGVMQHGVPSLTPCVLTTEVFLAGKFAKKFKGDPDGLTEDQIAAIHLYTQDTPIYRTLNAVLRERNRSLLLPFFPFLKLLLGGLYKLPLPATPKTIYRGVNKAMVDKYPKDREVIWWAFSSATASLDVLKNPLFLGDKGERTIFNIETRCFVDIRKYSAFQNQEDERLILPGTFLKVGQYHFFTSGFLTGATFYFPLSVDLVFFLMSIHLLKSQNDKFLFHIVV